MDKTLKRYLDQLLAIHWLRPESALWRALDCRLMHDIRPPVGGKSADFGCGTGMLSYIMAGGRVPNYDDFMNVSQLTSFHQGADIYNTKAAIKPNLDASGLRYTFTYGIDHKKGLIDKAKQFNGFYEKTLYHDLNKPLALEDRCFDWGFSNILYWLEDIPRVLKGWNRIIKPSGRLFLFVPNQHFKDKAWLYYKAPHRGEKAYLNFFDRGYNALIRHFYSRSKWKALFKRSGFRVMTHQSYLSNPVMEIWNIGLRPVFHLLIDMASRLLTTDRNSVKKEWIQFFHNFFLPVLQHELAHEQTEQDCAFHFFILENK